MTRRSVPVDDATGEDAVLAEAGWVAADGAHEMFTRLLDARPRARARYAEGLAELNARC